jgi:SAM-dependent methyltransferase
MSRRAQLIPWKVAGRVTEQQASADEVVQATGWVFNNETGRSLTLEEFVTTGDHEVPVYLQLFGLERPDDADRTFVEIGSGIGRMTCAFTRRYAIVYACDLDAGFLERCREAVARFGHVDHLRTVEVADGRTLRIADDAADVAFSYITLQHCDRDDALNLVREAIRVTRPGGQIALNFRTWSRVDPIVLPLGAVMRALFRVPGIGPALSRRRLPTRLAWQANRLDVRQVIDFVRRDIDAVTIWRNPARLSVLTGLDDVRFESFDGIDPSHWWLVATVR